MKRTAFLLVFSLCVAGIPAAAAPAKNYYFPEVRVEIAVDRDGSFRVDEFRTYEFQGSFSWADLRIPLVVRREGRSYAATLSEFSVSDERGAPLKSETGTGGGAFQARWHYSAMGREFAFAE